MDFVHKVDASQRKKYLDTYSQIWAGSLLAYDEGLIKGDSVLASAIWRQLFNADESIEPVKIALVTAYVRRELARLGRMDDKVLARGYIGFGDPVEETDILMQSPLMRVPFESRTNQPQSSPSATSARKTK